MSFLQPAMLLALPVIALPIIIHLINQRRFQTVQWAAMQFLLAANRMSRGYARLRQWLILAARTLAVAGLIFAISRPLASGWLGLAGGGRVDTTIILLDRSPSMTGQGPGGISKLQAGVAQLSRSLELLRSSRYVVIDSATQQASEIESADVLADLPVAGPVSQSADIPAMLEVAGEYIRANRPSRCEVWICSDVRRHDWKDDSGRWDAMRKSMAELPQMVRFHLLAYDDPQPGNRTLRVTKVRRVEDNEGPQLLLSLRIEQHDAVGGRQTIPIQLDLDGARSEFSVEMTGSELEVRNYAVPLDSGRTRGWGRVSIPADGSPADNEYYFVYDEEIERQTLIVTDDPQQVRPLEFASAVSPNPEINCRALAVAGDQFLATELDTVSLVLWQTAVPQPADPAAAVLEDFCQRGGQVIFLPPSAPTESSFAGLRWGQWQEDQPTRPATWVGDQDLLARTRSGASLPVGELDVSRYCEIVGDATTLATLDGGAPLLARAMTDRRNVYFLGTTTSAEDSSLAQGGVVLYAMIHRALAAGSQSLGNTRQFVAGEVADADSSQWKRLAGDPNALSNVYAKHAGVYEFDDQLLSINRSLGEDIATIVPEDRVESLFGELEFDRVDDRAGSSTSLIQEVWRLFLILMLVALVIEAVLCIPRRAAQAGDAAGKGLAG